MILQLAAIGVTLSLAILGVFFSKNGESNKLAPVGYVVISLILVGSLLSAYGIFEQQWRLEQESAQRAEADRAARRAQNAAMMQLVDIERPFEFANANFSLFLDWDDYERARGEPKGIDLFFGIVPMNVPGTTTRISVGVPEYSYRTFEFVPNGDSVDVAEEDIVYSIDTNGACTLASGGECEGSGTASGPYWFFESVAPYTGGGYHVEDAHPAAYALSKLQQTSNVGLIEFRGGDQSKTRRIVEYLADRLSVEFYFLQPYEDARLEECRRAVTVRAKLSQVTSTDKAKGNYCPLGSECLVLENDGFVDVEMCENSRI